MDAVNFLDFSLGDNPGKSVNIFVRSRKKSGFFTRESCISGLGEAWIGPFCGRGVSYMYQSLIAAGWILLSATVHASAQDRLALFISTDTYQSLAPLKAAQEDAQRIAEGLADLGFDVTSVINANLRFQRFSIRQYYDTLQNAAPGSVGVLYYQGHGVTLDTANYLLPANFQGGDAGDIARTSIAMNMLLAAPKPETGSTSVVILDCCAANPFGGEEADDAVLQGFAEVPAPEGVVLAYAVPAETTALDDRAFAQNLISGISSPGASLQDVLNGLGPNYVSDGAASPIILVPPVELSEEDIAWISIRETSDPDAVLAFLEIYPDGPYSDSAQALIVDLLAAELADDANTPPPDQIAAAPAPNRQIKPQNQHRGQRPQIQNWPRLLRKLPRQR